jgi:hypothetical protein
VTRALYIEPYVEYCDVPDNVGWRGYPYGGAALCAHCGADVCWCSRCTETLRQLRAGIRDHKALGRQGVLAEWTWNETEGWVKMAIAFFTHGTV